MKKKILAFFTIAMLVFTLAPPENVSAKAKISKKSVTITKGKTYTLKIKGTKKKAKWTSSKKSVATVSKKGKIKAKKRGSATITAKIGKKKYRCKVKVETPTLSSTKKSIVVGGRYTLKLNGCSRSKKFYTSNKSIATVSNKGVITAKKQGNAKITVKISDKKFYCSITITPKKVYNKPKPVHTGSIEDPKDAYELFTSDMYDNADYLGNFSIKLIDLQHGSKISGITPITPIDGGYKNDYGSGELEYLYLKFDIQYNYGKDIICPFDIFKNKYIDDIGVYYYNFYDYDFKGYMQEWIRLPKYYDSCPNIKNLYMNPGSKSHFSILMVIPKGQNLLGYKLQTGVNIGSGGDAFYTFTHFSTNR